MPTRLDIFYDYTCEDSYALSKRLLAGRAAHPDLMIRWRAFPLEWANGAPHGVPALLAFRAAWAALAQGEAAFYRFHPLLFDAYHAAGRDISDPDEVRAVAVAAGLDVPRWEADAGLSAGGTTSEIEAEIAADYQDARANFIFGTPTVIVDGNARIFDPGALAAHTALVLALIG